jgi:transposase
VDGRLPRLGRGGFESQTPTWCQAQALQAARADVLSWLSKSPKAFGYKTDLWTTRRLAEVIENRYGVRFNSNYLAAWLTDRGLSPQKPM